MSTDDVLARWTAALTEALGLDGAPTEIAEVLDLARDAAHAVARPAAPLTTFLVGYAAALRGGSAVDVEAATEIARRLSEDFEVPGP